MKKMKAIVLNEIKNFDSLGIQEVNVRSLQPHEVRVQIRASALNHRDIYIVQGLYSRIRVPCVLGSDGAGIVTEVGNEVDENWLKKEVIINPSLNWESDPVAPSGEYRILGMPDDGTQAEFINIPADNIIEKPGYLSFEAAAAIPLVGLTGYRALFTKGQLRPGETVLLTGIGGGVASLMLKMAQAAGASVLVTSGDDAKIGMAKEAGAIDGANYKQDDWPRQIKDILGKNKLDLVVDSAGGSSFDKLIDLLKPGGRIVSLGVTAGNFPKVNLGRLFWRQISLHGTRMGNAVEFRSMVRMFETFEIEPFIDKIYSFKDFRKAYERVMSGKQFGKVVLSVK